MSQLSRTVRYQSFSPATWLAILFALAPVVLADEHLASPFDGTSLAGWTTQSGDPVTHGWEIVDGVIHLKKEDQRAGNILTAVDYGDFDLSFEFKIAPGGNSGIKYRVRSFGGRILGCEYQILDDWGLSHKRPTKGTTGSLYDVYEPAGNELLMRPQGEFNTARIVVRGSHIQHWLNGQLIVSACVGGPEWNHRIANSKFSDVEGFGHNRLGKIMLTDHGSEVWYKNFRMQSIDSTHLAAGWGRAGGRLRRNFTARGRTGRLRLFVRRAGPRFRRR